MRLKWEIFAVHLSDITVSCYYSASPLVLFRMGFGSALCLPFRPLWLQSRPFGTTGRWLLSIVVFSFYYNIYIFVTNGTLCRALSGADKQHTNTTTDSNASYAVYEITVKYITVEIVYDWMIAVSVYFLHSYTLTAQL